MLEQGRKQLCVHQTWVEFECHLLCFYFSAEGLQRPPKDSNKAFMQPEHQSTLPEQKKDGENLVQQIEWCLV